MSGKLDGKAALITGGASGMGEAQARLFSREGAAVTVADVNEEKAAVVAGQIEKDGGRALALKLDVREVENWKAVVEAGVEAFGRLDILCNNAGTNVRVGFEELEPEQFRLIVDVNLTGTYLGCRAVGEPLKQASGGAILNIGSLSSHHHGGSSGYTASKTAILAITKNVALGYAKYGIRCNVICPGHVDTPFIRADAPHSRNDWSTSADNPENYERRRAGVPLGRLQTANDIATAALFLCSDDAQMITGAVLNVDGGSSLL